MTDEPDITFVSADDPNCVSMLIGSILEWHSHGMDTIQHLLDVPEGTETVITMEETEHPMTLSGEMRKAFIAGVIAASSAFVELPFVTTSKEDSTDESQANTLQ